MIGAWVLNADFAPYNGAIMTYSRVLQFRFLKLMTHAGRGLSKNPEFTISQ